MATTTPNYGLRKPADTGGVVNKGDLINVTTDISNNMDIIDTQIKAINDLHVSTRHVGHAPLDSGDVTSTSYVAARSAGTVTGVVFTCPASGIVTVGFGCGLIHAASATAFMLANIYIRTGNVIGSGADVFNANGDFRAIQHAGTAEQKAGKIHRFFTNMTPGSQYNVQIVYRVQSGTMTVTAPEILVIPSP